MNSYNISNMFTPDYSHLTGLVKHLNTEELKSILNNDDKANEIINDLKQVKDIEAEKEMIFASNRSISEYNLSQKTILEQTREDLDTTYKRAVELKEKLLAAKTSIENKNMGHSKDTLLALLQAAASEIEEEAEATVDAFLRKDLSVEDFLEKYLELRKLAHLRRIKSEKLSTIIKIGENSTCTPEKPLRLRKPPPPPVPSTTSVSSAQPMPNTSSFSYPNFSPYVNTTASKNILVAPSRPAPQPPPIYPSQNYPNSNYPSPFTYYSPYTVPPSARFPPSKKA